jgi:hypothetical protein
MKEALELSAFAHRRIPNVFNTFHKFRHRQSPKLLRVNPLPALLQLPHSLQTEPF